MHKSQDKEVKTIKAILFALNHHPYMDKGDKNEILVKHFESDLISKMEN